MHTKGPWTINEINPVTQEKDEYYIFIEPDVAVIEKKVERQNQSDLPNAQLIAAAPDLLESLEMVLEECIWPNATLSVAYTKAKNALKKAKGVL